MSLQSTQVSAVMAILLAGALTGCGRGLPEEDPSVSVAALLGEGSDSAHALHLAGLAGGPALASSGAGPTMPTRCDAEPDVVSQVVCAVSLPESMHFEWTACGAPPGDGPSPPEDFSCPNHGGVPQGEEIMSQGTMDISNTVTLDPVIGSSPEAIIGCDSSTVLSWRQKTTLSMERGGRWGSTMSLSSTSESSAKHSLDATSLEISSTLDTLRTIKDEGGEVQKSVRVKGQVNALLDRSAMPPTRTLNGTLDTDFGQGDTGSVQLKDIVRQAPMVCFWPISGSMIRTDSEGQAHTLVFGPGCGEAKLDGEAISLHVGRGGPGGPLGRE